jgi:hypothetical protein
MVKTLVWVLTFSVLGPIPENGESPKYKSKQECQQALEQKRQEYKSKHKTLVGSCHQTTKE